MSNTRISLGHCFADNLSISVSYVESHQIADVWTSDRQSINADVNVSMNNNEITSDHCCVDLSSPVRVSANNNNFVKLLDRVLMQNHRNIFIFVRYITARTCLFRSVISLTISSSITALYHCISCITSQFFLRNFTSSVKIPIAVR